MSRTPADLKSTAVVPSRLWTPAFVLVSLVNLATFMAFNMTNTGMPVFVSMLGGSPFQVGLVTTLTTASALVTRPFTGLMVDRFGRKGILLAGVIVTLGSVALFPIVPIVPAILGLRFIQGLGWGLSSTATSTIAADVIPPRRFAEGMGYFSLTTSISAAIAPALSIVLLEQAGIETMIAVSIACAGAALAFALPARFRTPAALQKPPVPFAEAKARADSGKAAESDDTPSAQPGRKGRFSLDALFERRALVPSVLIFLMNVAFTPISTFIVLHGQDRGVEGISLYFIVYALVNLVTRPLIGKAIDRVGFFAPGILAAASVVVTMVMVAGAHSLTVFCVAGAFAGLGFGTSMGVFQTMAVGAVPPARRGVATSTYLFGLNGGMALGSLIAGMVAGPLGYGGMYLLMAAFPLIAGAVLLGVGPRRLAAYRPR